MRTTITNEDRELLKLVQVVEEAYERSHGFYHPLEKRAETGQGNTQICKICQRNFKESEMVFVVGAEAQYPGKSEPGFWLCDSCHKTQYMKGLAEPTGNLKELIEERDSLRRRINEGNLDGSFDLAAAAQRLGNLDRQIGVRSAFTRPNFTGRGGRL